MGIVRDCERCWVLHPEVYYAWEAVKSIMPQQEPTRHERWKSWSSGRHRAMGVPFSSYLRSRSDTSTHTPAIEHVFARGQAGQHSAVRKGNAHTRRAHGTGTNSIIVTHFRPKHRITCFLVERTASR